MDTTQDLDIPDAYVSAAGVRTRYLSAGSGEPILLLHDGVPGDPVFADGGDVWLPVFRPLATRYRLIAIDRLGQGWTENPRNRADYSFDGILEHVVDAIKSLDVAPVHIVGHGLAGLLALRVAIDAPELVRSLTVINSNAAAPEAGLNELVLSENPYPEGEPRHAAWATAVMSVDATHATGTFPHRRLSMMSQPKYAEAAAIMFGTGQYENVFQTSVLAVKEKTFAHLGANAVNRPTMLIWGHGDPSCPINQAFDLYALLAKREGRVQLHAVGHSGHYPFREKPCEFARVLSDFIEDTRNGA
ncbi:MULTISPECIES: alpha/beta fold hydrolase [Neorhizobium]|uniref:alpha/beta fold hydrolase n=1 Tax=Neorhizobium TaxID=1525371 RepID=UPI000CFA44D7|nr:MULTISPECIES: alpha/beta hydrolase [Neorhizobium]